MRLFRTLATMAAGVWLGAMVLIAVVAQTTFSTMRITDVTNPNAIAGRIMAKNFSRFDVLQMTCAAIIVLWQVIQLLVGPRQRRDWVRSMMIVVACGLLTYSVAVLTPTITDMQTQVAQNDVEVKAVFDRFHQKAVRVSKINLIMVALIAGTLAWPGLRNERTIDSLAQIV